MITLIVAPRMSVEDPTAPHTLIRSGVVLDVGRVIGSWHVDQNGHIYAYIHPLGKTFVGTDETQLALEIASAFAARNNRPVTKKQDVINKLKQKYGEKAAGPAALEDLPK